MTFFSEEAGLPTLGYFPWNFVYVSLNICRTGKEGVLSEDLCWAWQDYNKRLKWIVRWGILKHLQLSTMNGQTPAALPAESRGLHDTVQKSLGPQWCVGHLQHPYPPLLQRKGKIPLNEGFLLKIVCWENSYKVHMVHNFCVFVKNWIKNGFFREIFTNASQT